MKKIIQLYIPGIAMLILMSGCNDFLDKKVLGYSTSEDFYNTTYKLQSALNATYNVLESNDFNECEWRFGDATSDDVWGSDEGLSTQMGQLVNFRFNTSNTWIQTRYEINYKGIHKANQIIANTDKVKLSTQSYAAYQEVRQILGQAKFLRALFYFNLVKTYGGVPIRPEIETIDSLVIPRSTASEVYQYIEKDLREASIMLPSKFIGNDAGKADAGACIGLLMKVILYQTTPEVSSDKWKDLMKLGEYFVDGGTMTYGDILDSIVDVNNWEALRNRLWFKPKAISDATDPYELPTTVLPQLNNNYSLEYLSYYGKSITYNDQFCQIGEFCKGSVFEVVFKESGDGTTGDVNNGSGIYDELYSNNPQMWTTLDIIQEIFSVDARRSFNITHNGTAPDGDICLCGPSKYVSLKWYTPIAERPQYSGDNGKNRRYMRYGEVVLMYAEALNECGFGQRALEQLNSLKSVTNKINGSSVLYIAGGYGFMRDQIWQERRIELCFEWDRFFDLVRQKRAASVIQNYGAKRANKRGYYFRKGVNELFPIPQSEIDISNGVVVQNPGY